MTTSRSLTATQQAELTKRVDNMLSHRTASDPFEAATFPGLDQAGQLNREIRVETYELAVELAYRHNADIDVCSYGIGAGFDMDFDGLVLLHSL